MEPTSRKYSSTESASCINISAVIKKVKKHILFSDPDIPHTLEGRAIRSSELLTQKMEDAMKEFDLNGQRFDFIHSPNHLGGTRWYVVCPGCKEKFLKLYKPVLESGKEQKFKCAECHLLKSPSALFGPTPKYREVIKPLRRMDKIKELIKTNRKLTDPQTSALLDEYEALKAGLESSVIYRRIKFSIETEGLDPKSLLS